MLGCLGFLCFPHVSRISLQENTAVPAVELVNALLLKDLPKAEDGMVGGDKEDHRTLEDELSDLRFVQSI